MTHSRHVRDAQDEANCVEDVTLSTAVETCDCIEALIKARDVCAHGIAGGEDEGNGVRDSTDATIRDMPAVCSDLLKPSMMSSSILMVGR